MYKMKNYHDLPAIDYLKDVNSVRKKIKIPYTPDQEIKRLMKKIGNPFVHLPGCSVKPPRPRYPGGGRPTFGGYRGGPGGIMKPRHR